MHGRKLAAGLKKSEAVTPVEERTPDTPPQQVVVRRCGHPEPLAEIGSRDCAACKARRHNQRMPPDSGRGGRLPHGAIFHVTYDDEKQQWTGSLNMPTPVVGPEVPTFWGTAGGVFYLLRQLDRQYREWKRSQAEAKP